MTSETPCDAEGRPLAGTATAHRSENPLFTASHPTGRFRRAIQRRVQIELTPLAEAMRDRLVGHDEMIEALRADLDAARREIAEMQRALDLHMQLAGMAARIAALEADASSTITGERSTSNGSAHHHG